MVPIMKIHFQELCQTHPPIEIGNKQQRKVSEILTRNNYRIKHKIKDYRDNVRFLVSTLKK